VLASCRTLVAAGQYIWPASKRIQRLWRALIIIPFSRRHPVQSSSRQEAGTQCQEGKL